LGEKLEVCLLLKDELLPMPYTKKVFQQESPSPEKIEMIMSKKLIVYSTVRRERERERNSEFIRPNLYLYKLKFRIRNAIPGSQDPQAPIYAHHQSQQ